MSRGDEIEPDQPRKPRRKADDAAARWGDDDDALPIKHRQRSAFVTTVGVLAIVLGCLVLIGSLCVPFIPLFTNTMLDVAAKQNPNDPNLKKAQEAMNRIPLWYLFGTAAVDFCRSIGLLVGGIAVIRRASFGRPLTLAMAGLGVVMFLVGLAATFALGTMNTDDPSSIAGGVGGMLCGALLNLGFAVLAFAALLPAKNAAEFRA